MNPSLYVTANPVKRGEYVRRNFATRTRMSPASGDVPQGDLHEALVCSRIRYRLYVRARLNKRVSHAASKVPTLLPRERSIPLSENNKKDDGDFLNSLTYEIRPKLTYIMRVFADKKYAGDMKFTLGTF